MSASYGGAQYFWAVRRQGGGLQVVGVESVVWKKFFKTISQGDFGHFRENNQIIVSKVAKIALKIFLN